MTLLPSTLHPAQLQKGIGPATVTQSHMIVTIEQLAFDID